MRSIKIITALALGWVLLIPVAGKAQSDRLTLNLNYNVGIPTGSFKSDVVNDVSARGWTANLMYGINQKLSVGFGTGFQDFYQKYPRAVYKLNDGGDISAVLSNSIQTIPLLAVAQYNFAAGKTIQPYVGLGAGGNVVMYKQYLGEFTNVSRNKFAFAVRPEVGVFIPFRKDNPAAGINVNGAYNYMPYNTDGLENINHVGVGIGVRFPLR